MSASWLRHVAAAALVLLPAVGCGSSSQNTGYSPSDGGADADVGADAAADASADGDAAPDVFDAGEAEAEAPAKLGPPYPIVLAHGFFGFQDFAGLKFETYFYQVKDDLAQRGETHVYTPAVDPFNDSTARGAQLADAIQQILADTGYAKVNIIGHSQGGLDARVVAHDHADWVASVVTYATPNQGTAVSDLVLKLIADPNSKAIADELVKLIGGPLYDQIGNTTSITKGLAQFSSQGIADFNAKYPDAPGVAYYSIAGRTDLTLGLGVCDAPNAPPFVKNFSLVRDPVDLLLGPTNTLLDNGLAQSPNDGLVTVASAKHGTFLGCIPADHLDEVGQILGDNPGLGNTWRHKPFFAALVTYLHDHGY